MAFLSNEGPANAVETADVQRGELLERRRREIDAAGSASRAGVHDSRGDRLAVGAGDDHLAATHRVAGGEGTQSRSNAAQREGKGRHTRWGSRSRQGSW